jgi:hypothetical protein
MQRPSPTLVLFCDDSGLPRPMVLAMRRFKLRRRSAVDSQGMTHRRGDKRWKDRVRLSGTPVEGLYLAGHWTQPGVASLRVFVSGIHAAKLVLRDAGKAGAADAIQHRDLPPI